MRAPRAADRGHSGAAGIAPNRAGPPRHWLIASAVLLAVGGLDACRASGQPAAFRAVWIAPDTIRVDGWLRDSSRVRFVEVGDGDDASLRIAFGHDRTGLFIAASVRDERVVRVPRAGLVHDGVHVVLVRPRSEGAEGAGPPQTALRLWLLPGIPGRVPSEALLGDVNGHAARPVGGARLVEGPRADGTGYELEAHVPFSALGIEDLEGLHATIGLRDVDVEARPVVERELWITRPDPSRPQSLPRLWVEGGRMHRLRDLLRSRGIDVEEPDRRLRADLTGDGRAEEVYLADRIVAVPRGGAEDAFHYFELPVASGADVRSIEATDLTGDGASELVVVIRQHGRGGSRELWQVLGLSADGLRPRWTVETGRQLPTGERFGAIVRVRRQTTGPPLLDVQAVVDGPRPRVGSQPAVEPGIEPMPLPWGPVIARTYRWNGQRFAPVAERRASATEPHAPAPVQAERTSDAPPSAEPFSVDRMLETFRRQLPVAASEPARWARRANVAVDSTPEHLLVVGRFLLVLGPAFRGGTG
ncbi:MAG: hypothetical protein NZ898_01275 [Myxococcota bacterium]|nr:hypothetical protein [Myxococcota bacterium]